MNSPNPGNSGYGERNSEGGVITDELLPNELLLICIHGIVHVEVKGY